jgi:hypothetical protein
MLEAESCHLVLKFFPGKFYTGTVSLRILSFYFISTPDPNPVPIPIRQNLAVPTVPVPKNCS